MYKSHPNYSMECIQRLVNCLNYLTGLMNWTLCEFEKKQCFRREMIGPWIIENALDYGLCCIEFKFNWQRFTHYW